MLQQPDKATKRILELADFIEKLPPDQYNQSTYGTASETGRCICGWLLHNIGHPVSDYKYAADLLGLDPYATQKLFGGNPLRTRWPTTADAAKVLRHLAVTGEVNWSICEEERSEAFA